MTRIVNGYPIRGIISNLAAEKHLYDGYHLEFAIKKTRAGFRIVRSHELPDRNYMIWTDDLIPIGTSNEIRTEEQFENAISAALEKYYLSR